MDVRLPFGASRCQKGLVALMLAGFLPINGPSALADDRVDARQVYQAGMQLFEAGQFEAGIQKWEEAYSIRPNPDLLYQIGAAYSQIGNYQKSIFFLEQYLQTGPSDKTQIQAHIASLEDALRAQQRPVQAQPGVDKTPTQEVPENTDSGDYAQLDPKTQAQLDELLNKVDRLLGDGAGGANGPAFSGNASGAVLQDGGIELEEKNRDLYGQTVVTASRLAQDPKDAPNALTIITAEDIRQSGARTLPDLLRRVPGMEVMAISPGDVNLGMRGFNATLSNKVLILVDGRSTYLDFLGANLWPLMSISPEDIDRIEVIRGPGAALYGANAFSGVVNIITKRPGESGDFNTLTLRTGLPDWVSGSAHVGGNRGDVDYRLSLGFDQADRWSAAVEPDRVDYSIAARVPESATAVVRADGRLDHHIADNTILSLSAGVAQGQVEFAAIGALRDFVLDGTYGYLRGDMTLPVGLSLRAFWNHLDADAQQWSYPTGGDSLYSNVRTDIVDVELMESGKAHFLVDHQFNIGVGYRYKGVTWDYLGSSPEENHFRVFAQDEMRFSPKLAMILSLRADSHPLLAARDVDSLLDRLPISPRAAVIYHLNEESTLRFTAGTAFRTPTFLESYLDLYVPTTTTAAVVESIGNLELGPERIKSVEVGYLHSPRSERYEIQVAAFANQVNDLMALAPVAPDGHYDESEGVYVAGTTGQINIPAPYTALGGELAFRFVPLRGLDLYANYAYINITQDGDDAWRSTSPHKVNGGIQFRSTGGFETSVDLSWSDDQVWSLRSFDENGQPVTEDVLIPQRTWMGARLGYSDVEERLELSITMTNLLALLREAEVADPAAVANVPHVMDTEAGRYREHPVGQLVPPGFSVGLRYRF